MTLRGIFKCLFRIHLSKIISNCVLPVYLVGYLGLIAIALLNMQIKYNFWQNWKSAFFLFFLYFLAHFLLIFSNVVMWDGWLWTNLLKQKDYETLYQLLRQTTLLHVYAVYRVIDWLGNPVTISNILVFISWFIAGLVVYLILKNFARLGEKNAFFVASIFLLLPLFIVRFEISMLTYSLSNAAFFLGAYTFLRSMVAVRPLSRFIFQILALIFFISSFFTASFLVFYGSLILFAFFLFLQKESLVWAEVFKKRKGIIFRFLKKNIFWLLLPFIFYLAHKKFIGSPYGLYAGYNSFVWSYPEMTLFNFASIVLDRIFQFIVYGFFGPLIFSISILQRKIFFAIFLIFLISIFFFERKFKVLSSSAAEITDDFKMAPKTIFIWGVLLSVFASLAYILVGESPNPYGSGFDLRHGLILPLGFSLIILSFIDGLLNNKIRKLVKIIFLAVLLTYNIYHYYTLDMDWYKQMGVIESIRENYIAERFGERDIFVFYDKMPLYKWRGRSIKDHEYTAYLYEATGNSKLLGTSVGEDLRFMGLVKKDELDFGDEPTRTRFKNIVISGTGDAPEPTAKNWLKLKLTDLFGEKEELLFKIKNLIGVNTRLGAEVPREASWFDQLPVSYR